MPNTPKPSTESWRVNAEYVTYPGPDGLPKTVARGEVCDDLPERSVKWLADEGQIVKAEPEQAGPAKSEGSA